MGQTLKHAGSGAMASVTEILVCLLTLKCTQATQVFPADTSSSAENQTVPTHITHK